MNTLPILTLLSGWTLSPLLSAEPQAAAHPLFQAIREGDAAKVDVLLYAAALRTRRNWLTRELTSRRKPPRSAPLSPERHEHTTSNHLDQRWHF
jgi:hypothetical protein